ncbi:MAG: hypothetical protein ACTHLR_05470 [Rhizomicrobium sp.]
MTRPVDIKRVAHILSADEELMGIERRLRRAGDWRAARKIAGVRQTLAKALHQEQEDIYEHLLESLPGA